MGGGDPLTFVTKANCPLCDKARAVLEQVALPAGRAWAEADILDDAGLFEVYRHRVPVLRVGGCDVLCGRFPPRAVRRALGLGPACRVLCLGLPEAEPTLRAAGMEPVRAGGPHPDAVAVAAARLDELPPGLAAPVVLVGEGGAGRAPFASVLAVPLYPPDLVARIESLV